MTNFCTAISGPRFWKASWICATLMCLGQLSGINLLSIYVYSMLGNIAVESEGKFQITPVIGGFMLSVANLVFAALISPIVPMLRRKTLAMCGCLGMLLCNISVGVCLQRNWYMIAFISMISFNGFFCMPGNVIYIYVSEVTVD